MTPQLPRSRSLRLLQRLHRFLRQLPRLSQRVHLYRPLLLTLLPHPRRPSRQPQLQQYSLLLHPPQFQLRPQPWCRRPHLLSLLLPPPCRRLVADSVPLHPDRRRLPSPRVTLIQPLRLRPHQRPRPPRHRRLLRLRLQRYPPLSRPLPDPHQRLLLRQRPHRRLLLRQCPSRERVRRP